MPEITTICHDSPTRDTCPTLYASDDGRLFIQGFVVDDQVVLSQLRIPIGETVVEITPKLLAMMSDPSVAHAVRTSQSA